MAEQSGSPDIFKQNKQLIVKQKVVKHITIYNQSDVHIKVIATEREEVNLIKDLIIKQERNTKKEEKRQEIESDINTTSHSQNDENQTSQNRNKSTLRDSTKDYSGGISYDYRHRDKSNESTQHMEEKESHTGVDVGVGFGQNKADDNLKEKRNHNHSEKSRGGNIGFKGMGVGGNYKSENESSTYDKSHDKSDKKMSISADVGYGSSSKDKQQDITENTKEKGSEHNAKLEGTVKERRVIQSNAEQATVVHDTNDILMNLEQHNSSNRQSRAGQEVKEGFEAKVVFKESTSNQQYQSQSLIAPQTSQVLSYHGAMIRITIYHRHNGKWINDCENVGCDADYYLFQRNGRNQLEFVPCCDQLKQKLDGMMAEKRDATLIAQSNKQEMNDWEDYDVARFIHHLSRKYGDKVIDSEIAEKVEKANVNGSRLLTIKGDALKRIINDKNVFRIVWDELKHVQKGEVAVPSKEELNYKMISEWSEQMVMMFIATICDGKYYKYKECFDALTGNDLLKMNQKEDIARDIKYDSMITDPRELNEIWMKLAEIQQNQNVPSERDLADDYERVEHPTVIIKCFIVNPSASIVKQCEQQPHEWESIEVKLPTATDWIQNLQELQWIIVTTFPFLKSIAYLMRIDDTIIDNSDPQRLGNLIRIASSVPVIELIQNPNVETYFTITAHSNSDQTIEYPLSSNKREWTSKVYDDLLCSIAKAFGVPNDSRLSIYESIGNRVSHNLN
eukprot:704437_1